MQPPLPPPKECFIEKWAPCLNNRIQIHIMHCLLGASFTHVCLQLIFYCSEGQDNIILYFSWTFQVIINGKQTRVKQNSKQTVHSVSTVPLPQQMSIRKKVLNTHIPWETKILPFFLCYFFAR